MNHHLPLLNRSPIQKSQNYDSRVSFTHPYYVPGDKDILCGRGKAFLGRPANRKFADIVRSKLQQYIKAPSRKDKSRVVASIVKELNLDGIRFLKRDNRSSKTTFYELNDFEAREKTGHALRDCIKAGKLLSLKKQDRSTSKPKQQSDRQIGTKRSRSYNPYKIATIEEAQDIQPLNERSNTLALTFESIMEYGLFDLVDDDKTLLEPKYNETQESMTSMKKQLISSKTFRLSSDRQNKMEDAAFHFQPQFAPLPKDSKIRITLDDILKINDILSYDN